MVFKTERLYARELTEKDKDFFIELLSAPEIIDPIPQPKWSMDEILNKFKNFSSYSEDTLSAEKVIWGVYENGKTELIGLCALLTNDQNQREIGYRFRAKYWGKGYGTEITSRLITHAFNQLGLNILAADVNIANIGSVKILEKFFQPVKEFYNHIDGSTDRRYELKIENWVP